MNSFSLTQDLANTLLACLCTAVSGMPSPPRNCCFRVGTEPVHGIGLDQLNPTDLCCEGLAYVLLRDNYPSEASFPDADIIRQVQGACPPATWAVAFRIGIVGCVTSSDDCASNNADFITNLYRMQALNEAVCCFRSFMNTSSVYAGMSLVIERQVQGSTTGGCTERYVNLVAQIPNLECSCG